VSRGLLARKLGMTQIFDEEGRMVPVSVLETGSCCVTQVKTDETDGYNAVQLAFHEMPERKVNKPAKGHFARAGVKPRRYLKEFRLDDSPEGKFEMGQQLGPDIFKAGDKVDVTGLSKGKGFAGSIKRHGFHRGPMTHGSKYHRGPGSRGASASPSRVFKGKKLPGHMGAEKVTVQGLKVVRVDVDRNLLLVQGSVPGPRGSVVAIKQSTRA